MPTLKPILSAIRVALFKRCVEQPLLAEYNEKADRILSTLERLEARDLNWSDLVQDHPTPWAIPERNAVGKSLASVLSWSFRSAMLEHPGVSYMEIKLPSDDPTENITVTIQRVSGPTASDCRRVAEELARVLAENLIQHGKHDRLCATESGEDQCTCGLDPAVQLARNAIGNRKATR